MSSLRMLEGPSKGSVVKERFDPARGGIGSLTKSAAAIALNAVPLNQLNVNSGVAGLDQDGQVISPVIPFDAMGSISVAGPTLVSVGSVTQYLITNFDSFTEYSVEAIDGGVEINEDQITYYAPNESIVTGFVLNGREYQIQVQGAVPDTPSITTSQQVGALDKIDVTLLGSAFNVSGNVSLHQSTDWQIATDPAFTNVIRSSMNDLVNKLSITFTGIDAMTQIYVRARYRDTNGLVSSYGASNLVTMTPAPTVSLNGSVTVYAANETYIGIGTYTGQVTEASVSPGNPKFGVTFANGNITLRTTAPTLQDHNVSLSVTLSNGSGSTTRTITLQVLPLAANPTVFPNPTINQGYATQGDTFFINNELGGVYPAPVVDFQLVSGDLPGGMIYSSTGAQTSWRLASYSDLYGAPGNYPVRLRAMYDTRYTNAAPYEFDTTITVNPISFTIQTTNWTFGVNQSIATFTPRKQIAGSPDSGIIGATVHTGALPPGVSIIVSQGGNRDVIITGTPTQAGVYTFTLMCTSPYFGPQSPKESPQITITINP